MAIDMLTILPEITVLLGACLLLLIETFRLKNRALYGYLLALATLVIAGLLLLTNIPEQRQVILKGAVVYDQMAVILKLAILLFSFVGLWYSRCYLQQRDLEKTEYYSLGLFAVLGMMVMVSGASMLSLYMGLELMSLSLYALVALARKSSRASEAAVKYFVLGAIASGMLLYGMSFIYGLSGSLSLADIATTIPKDSLLVSFALVFIIAGLAFKLGVAPFHMWLPDVYEGAPSSVTLFISTAPKVAVFAMVMRMLVEGMGDLFVDWQQILIALALLSIALGNTVAIAQSNLKRMLAYSSIAHMGFFLLGILSGTNESYAAAMFYVLVYALTALGGFGIILLLSKQDYEAEELNNYKGLAKRHPWYAFLLLILLFSMAGVPPTIGFYAKLSVLQSVIGIDKVWIAVVAIIFSVIGAYYYLRMVVYVYFNDTEKPTPKSHPAQAVGVLFSINALLVLLLGLFPAGLLALCVSTIAKSLGG